MGKLKGKVVVITGGNSGIGLSAARLFRAEGAKVAIVGRDLQTLESALKELGPHAIAIQADVGITSDIQKIYTRTHEAFGNLDVLFVNAGIAQFGPLKEVTEDVFDQTMNVNLKGAFFTVQKAIPYLNKNVSILLTTSVLNGKGWPNTSVYSASKAGLRSLARTLSAELLEKNIRVNAINPGPIETPIYNRLGLAEEELEGFSANVKQTNPMKRFGSSEEVASVALFLASSDSSYITGTEVPVDGGAGQL